MIQALQYLKDKEQVDKPEDADVIVIEDDTADDKENTDKEVKNGDEISTPVTDNGHKDEVQKIKDDHYSSSKPDEFSSEHFKLEIGGLPKYFPLGHFKKLLNNVLQLDAHKVKPGGFGRNVAYVNFKNEETKTKARLILDGYSWQNSKLTAINADPAKDPVLLKKIDFLVNAKEFQDLPLADRITKAVTPYHNLSYEDQIKEKEKVVKNLMKKFAKEIAVINPELQKFVNWQRRRRHGQVCQLDDFVQAPVKEGYRNKCEFTIGQSCGSKDPVVGFRVASYKEGSVEVGPIDHLKHINQQMKKVAVTMENFIKQSGYDVFQPFSHDGTWRQLTVRTSNNGDIMLIVLIHPQKMTEEDVTKLKDNLLSYFTSGGAGSDAMVTSIFIQRQGQIESGQEIEYEHCWGTSYIEETILGKTYCAAPDAFLQVNTPACEQLYTKVFEIADVDGMTVVLDVCCGVGTIGLAAAEEVHKVYGVELNESSVANARLNASNNDITNHVVFQGKAEDHIDNMIERAERFKTVAIIDPPRAGLHGSVMNALRKCEYLDTIVYISCDPQAAMGNFSSLCRARSKTYKGTFFVPMRAIPIDLFPDTPHFELIILFERYDECKWDRILADNPRPKDQAYFDTIPAVNYETEEDRDEKNRERRRTRRDQDRQQPFNTDRDIWGNDRKPQGYDDETQEYYGDEPEPFDPPMDYFVDNPGKFEGRCDQPYYERSPPRRPGLLEPPRRGRGGGRPFRPPPLMAGNFDPPMSGGRRGAHSRDYDHMPRPSPNQYGTGFEEGFHAALDALRQEVSRPNFGQGGGWAANSEPQAFPPPMDLRGVITQRGGRDLRGGNEDWTVDNFDPPPKRSRPSRFESNYKQF